MLLTLTWLYHITNYRRIGLYLLAWDFVCSTCIAIHINMREQISFELYGRSNVLNFNITIAATACKLSDLYLVVIPKTQQHQQLQQRQQKALINI